MKLLNTVKTELTRLNLPADTTVLCALSGGADSVCLLSLLRQCSQIRLAAAHVNHGIRGEEADRDEAFCRTLCEQNGIPFYSAKYDVPALALASGHSLEEEARNVRYAYLASVCKSLGDHTVIATAHHANDNAETVLFHLIRGTGLAGAAGIPAKRDLSGITLIRPMLGISRAEILEYLHTEGIEYILDSTNQDDSYARNYLRLHIIPALTKVNPRAAEHIAESAQHMRQDLDFIECAVKDAMQHVSLEEKQASCSAAYFSGLHPALQPRIASAMYSHASGDAEASLTQQHFRAIIAIAKSDDPSAKTNLPAGITARREYERLIIGKSTEQEPYYVQIREGETIRIPGFTIKCKKTNIIYNNLNTFTVDCLKIHGILSIRPRRIGDRIRPVGRTVTKTVKKAMIDLKIPREKRDTYPVIAAGDDVVAVYGIGCSADYAAECTENAVTIEITER